MFKALVAMFTRVDIMCYSKQQTSIKTQADVCGVIPWMRTNMKRENMIRDSARKKTTQSVNNRRHIRQKDDHMYTQACVIDIGGGYRGLLSQHSLHAEDKDGKILMQLNQKVRGDF